MDLYLSILKLFLTKEIYERFKDSLDKEFLRRNFPELLRIFLVYEDLWGIISTPSAKITDLKAVFYGKVPNADKALYEGIFSRIEASEADHKAIEHYLGQVQVRAAAAHMAFVSLDFAEGRTNSEALEAATLRYHELAERVSNPDTANTLTEGLVTDDIELLYEKAVKEGGLSWRLESLRRSLGPLRKGDFGFIFARPETGKTTFLASEVSHMAPQAQGPVLWFNNEETDEKVGLRLYEATLGVPLEKILANRPKARHAYEERTQGRVKLIQNGYSTNRTSIEKLCRLHNPSLIVIDQLDKVGGFSADREDLLLGAIYQWARELAKRFAPVIGVSQADGSGEGVKWLNMGNVANAKTAKQAEADWILGIGYNWEDPPNIRGFSICKNKLIGGEESVAELRHGRFEAVIQPDIARYRDIVL